MHDIDHTKRELEMEAEADHEHGGESFLGELFGEAEDEDEDEDEDEYEDEDEAEADGEDEGEDEAEAEGEYEGEDEEEYEEEYEGESPLSEEDELELASELLEVSNEAELDHFIKRKLYPKALGRHHKAAKSRGRHKRHKSRGRHRKAAVKAHARARRFARSRHGKGFGSMFKRLVKKSLPSVVKAGLPAAGTILGTAFGGPLGGILGGAAGDALGGALGNIFHFELEGLSPEERELEVARHIVRLGAGAARHAARAPRHVPSNLAVRRAFAAAAKLYAPGLLRRRRHCRHCGGAHHRGARCHVRRPDRARAVAGTAAPMEMDASQSELGEVARGPIGGGRSGRWFRRGRNVVLTGL